MTKQELIQITARELYFLLPWWKKRKFRKWMSSNNWDVQKIYTRCLREAKWMTEEEEKFKFE